MVVYGWRIAAQPPVYEDPSSTDVAKEVIDTLIALVMDRFGSAVTTGNADPLRSLADVAEEWHRHWTGRCNDPVFSEVLALITGWDRNGRVIRDRVTTDGDIAARCGVTARTVRELRKRLGIPGLPRGRRAKPKG